MSSRADPPAAVVAEAVARALAEDLTPLGDLTSALLPTDREGAASFVARAAGVVAGTVAAAATFDRVDAAVEVAFAVDDGDSVDVGAAFGSVRGRLASILTAERTALNFLCHLSGIATATRRMVEAAAPVGVWDTRKTVPGLRTLEKAAVRAGGGRNHRGNLSDWIMLKDNHLAVLGIADAVSAARREWPGRTVHVECDDLDQVAEALSAGADALLLDNMTPDEVDKAVALVEDHPGARPLLEASGSMTVETVRAYAQTGIDFVSSGAITMSAPSLDIALEMTPDVTR